MLIVEVDHVDAEPLQACVARALDVRGTTVDKVALAVRALDLTELGREDSPDAPAPEREPQQLLVVSPAVHVRGVDEIDPQVERTMHDVDGLLVIALAVRAGHGHAPEPDGRDLELAVPQLAILHGCLP